MRATLQDLKRQLGLRGTQLLDDNLQARLCFHLLKRRGYEAYRAGCAHRLAIPGKVELELIEAQVGSYTGEGDIIQIEDVYARVSIQMHYGI